MRDIGKNIRKLRTDIGMTQEELAEALFVTRQTVSNYETGKSHPDIDTLLLISQSLHTDVNTIIYGPQEPENLSRPRKWAIAFAVLLSILIIAYCILYPICNEMRKYYRVVPLLILRTTLRPAIFFISGWLFLHCISRFLKLKPIYSKAILWLQIPFFTLLCIFFLIPLPYIVWYLIGTLKTLSNSSVSLYFPNIPIYSAMAIRIIYLYLKAPFLMSVLGVLCQLLGIPHNLRKHSTIIKT